MKRVDLVRHVEANGCRLLREGANHSIYIQTASRKLSAIPRHREIKELLARKICKDLEVPELR